MLRIGTERELERRVGSKAVESERKGCVGTASTILAVLRNVRD